MLDICAADVCPICKCGPTRKSEETLSFFQHTLRGRVDCSVAVRVSRCGWCGARIWDRATEDAIDQAVLREYDTLP